MDLNTAEDAGEISTANTPRAAVSDVGVPASATPGRSTADELLKREQLYDQKVVTKAKYDAQKAKLLKYSFSRRSRAPVQPRNPSVAERPARPNDHAFFYHETTLNWPSVANCWRCLVADLAGGFLRFAMGIRLASGLGATGSQSRYDPGTAAPADGVSRQRSRRAPGA